MKKLAILLLVFLLPSVMAISLDLNENYSQSETLISKISGNILSPITQEDVRLIKTGTNQHIPINYDVKKLGDDYYLYMVLPASEGNFTIKIENILTTVSGRQEEIDFEQNLSTTNFSVLYSVIPGFILTESDFEINIFSYSDFPQTISLDFPEEHSITLEPGENKILFAYSDFQKGLTLINLGRYSLPIFILGEEEPQLPSLRILPVEIQSVILIGENKIYPVKLINSGETTIENIIVNYDSNLFFIEEETILKISPGETYEFNISLNEEGSNINDVIQFNAAGEITELPIQISFTEDIEETETPYLDEGFSESNAFYCSELGGTICSTSQSCSGDEVSSINGQCCLAECTEEQSQSLSWIGYLIGGILIIVLIIIFIKYRRSKKQESPQIT